jgi:hypothetical protein
MRPRPFDGEATPGYLMRVAAANGFSSVPQLLTSLKHRQQSAFDELTDRLCLTGAERNALYGALPARWGLDVLPSGLAVSDFNHEYRRWCPLCLKDSGIILGRWTLKLACVCTMHGVWLREACTACGRTGTWSEVDHLRCACLANLDGGPVEHADALHVMLQTVLNDEADASCATLGEFAKLLPSLAHSVVRYLGQFASQLRPDHPGQIACAHHLATAKALVVGTASLLASWPSGLHGLMAALQASALSSPSVRQTFSPLYRVLYRELSDPSAQFLRDAFESYLHEHWWGLVCRRNKLMRPHTISSHPRLTLPQAAAETGVPTSVVRHLLQAELIEGAITPLPSGRSSQTVHVDELLDIRAATAGALTLKDAARLLALPECRVRMLIAANVITPLISRRLNRKASAWLIGKAEVERLHVWPLVSKASFGKTVHDILKYGRLSEHEAIALVKAVCDGELKPRALVDGAVPIGQALVDTVEVKQWLDARRADSLGGISVDQAARVLGLKQQVVYHLVRCGLLRSTQSDGHGHRISLGDIERFQESYVSLAELARSEHRAPRALLCDIDVVPVTGPSIDGSRQYFFRRADLRTEMSPSWLTTGSRLSGGLPAQPPCGDDYD